MNKTALLADLAAKNLRVIAVTQQSDAAKEAQGVNVYRADVIQENGLTALGKAIYFLVFDEGQAGEFAKYTQLPGDKNVVLDAATTYLEGLRPSTFLEYKITDVDEEQRVVRADVLLLNEVAAQITEAKIIVYKIGSNPIAHATII